MSRVVQVTAPSRLHFGLWSLAGAGGRQFGGAGAMIEQPGLQLKATFATERMGQQGAATAPSLLAKRATEFAHQWSTFHHRRASDFRVEIEASPPEHVGLGTGTQLGLAVAAGLSALCDLPAQTPQELALSVGRGLRSAVGTYGFAMGGL